MCNPNLAEHPVFYGNANRDKIAQSFLKAAPQSLPLALKTASPHHLLPRHCPEGSAPECDSRREHISKTIASVIFLTCVINTYIPIDHFHSRML